MTLTNPDHLCYCYTRKNTILYIPYPLLLFYFMSVVSNQDFFLFLLPLPLCHLLFNHLKFLWMSAGLRAKFAVLARSSRCLDQGNLDLLLPEHKITIGRHQLICQHGSCSKSKSITYLCVTIRQDTACNIYNT